eukprot:3986425-Amphidinium_carterae.1
MFRGRCAYWRKMDSGLCAVRQPQSTIADQSYNFEERCARHIAQELSFRPWDSRRDPCGRVCRVLGDHVSMCTKDSLLYAFGLVSVRTLEEA